MKPKFRAWYKPDFSTEVGPHLFYQDEIDGSLYFTMAKDFEIGYDFCLPFIDPDWILEQTIGIDDIRGKNIFEGDILAVYPKECETNQTGPLSIEDIIFDVSVEKVGGEYRGKVLNENEKGVASISLKDYWFEIVGNIHENLGDQ